MNCRLCEAPARLYAPGMYAMDGVSYDLLRCRNCGVVFVNPFPDAGRIARLYDDEYFKHDYSFGIVEGDYIASEEVRIGEYRRLLSKIARLTDGRKILEVGCAAGAFLKEARAQGWNVAGVDISPWAVKTARERFNIDVRLGTLEDQKFPSASFDAIFFGDLLEHQPDPIGFLKEVKRVVKPRDDGGVVMAKVPTYVNSFYYRLLKTAVKIPRANRKSSAMLQLLKLTDSAPKLPPYHLFEFNPECVRWAFDKAGLQIFEEDRMLMIPEFLKNSFDAVSRALLFSFGAAKFLIESIGLHGGHVVVFAATAWKGRRK